MFRIKTMSAAAAAAAILSPQASAELVRGAAVVVPFDNAIVTIQPLGGEAYFEGVLHFLGSGDANSILVSAADTGEPGLGQVLFSNREEPRAVSVQLQGVFHAGDVLHFAYDVLNPDPLTFDLLRTDVTNDRSQFAFDASQGVLGVEDLMPDHPWFDEDYDDILVKIDFTSVPSPGAVTLLGLGMFIGLRRRSA